jgi:hypothetical protein
MSEVDRAQQAERWFEFVQALESPTLAERALVDIADALLREQDALRAAVAADAQIIADAYYSGNTADLRAADAAIQRLLALAAVSPEGEA